MNIIQAETKSSSVAKVGEMIKIITLNDRARLCPKPNCEEGEHLLRIPTNTELKVESFVRQRMPLWDVIWYKVTYKGKQGWISEFDTNKAPSQPRYR
jgi:hypothetical protein